MKVNHNTQIDLETRQALLDYCKETGKSIAQVTNEALVAYLKKSKEGLKNG